MFLLQESVLRLWKVLLVLLPRRRHVTRGLGIFEQHFLLCPHAEFGVQV